jgi:hypothetical protein
MYKVFSDDFNRTSETLGVSSSGYPWMHTYGNIAPYQNTAVFSNTPGAQDKVFRHLALVDVGTIDGSIDAWVNRGNNGDGNIPTTVLVLNYTNEANLLYLEIQAKESGFLAGSYAGNIYLVLRKDGTEVYRQLVFGSERFGGGDDARFLHGQVTARLSGNLVQVVLVGLQQAGSVIGDLNFDQLFTIPEEHVTNLIGTTKGIAFGNYSSAAIPPSAYGNYIDNITITPNGEPASFTPTNFIATRNNNHSATITWELWVANPFISLITVEHKMLGMPASDPRGSWNVVLATTDPTVLFAVDSGFNYSASHAMEYRISVSTLSGSVSPYVYASLDQIDTANGDATTKSGKGANPGAGGSDSSTPGSNTPGDINTTTEDTNNDGVPDTVVIKDGYGNILASAAFPPGAQPNDVITLRRDNNWIVVSYGGRVVITYLIDPVRFPKLFLPGAWIGFVDSVTYKRIATPLDGWYIDLPDDGGKYTVFAYDQISGLGLKNPLWKRAKYNQAYTLIWDETGHLSAEMQPLDIDIQHAPLALRGGYKHVVERSVAQQIVDAGYVRWIEGLA